MPFRRVARTLLAAGFIAGGVNTLLNSKPKTDAVEPLLDKARQRWPALPAIDPGTVVQAEGAVKIGAGLMMALGMAPRLAATLLAVDLVPSTVAEHPFWSELDCDDRKAEQMRFLSDAGLLGGLLLAITDTGGKPSLAWRAKHAKKDVTKGVKRASRRARERAALATS